MTEQINIARSLAMKALMKYMVIISRLKSVIKQVTVRALSATESIETSICDRSGIIFSTRSVRAATVKHNRASSCISLSSIYPIAGVSINLVVDNIIEAENALCFLVSMSVVLSDLGVNMVLRPLLKCWP